MAQDENIESMSEELKLLQKEWPDTLEILKEAKEETHTGDLFAALEYLSFCDQFCKAINAGIKKVNVYLSEINKHENKDASLIADYQEIKSAMQAKLQNIDEEYPEFAEETLRRAQDTITTFSEIMQREKVTPNVKTDITQNLEKDLYLQELRDSLELYRQAREEFLTEVEKDSKQRIDAGEEIDPILSQIETTIAECDTALLIREISE